MAPFQTTSLASPVRRGLDRLRAATGRTRWLLVIGAILSATIVAIAAVWIVGQERRSDDAVGHTFENERKLARVLSLLQDAELGQRGFLLTGDRFYLEPYDTAVREINAELDQLASAVGDNSKQDANVAVLRTLVAQKLSELRQTVERRQGGDTSGALLVLQNGQGKLLMDGIRDVVTRMQAEEERLMAVRTAEARAAVLRIEAIILALLLLSTTLAVAILSSTLNRARSAEASRDELLARFDRKLLAVLAADVTAYSRMMESDEAGTLTRLMAMRAQVDPLIEKHGGRITSTAGDSILAVFSSALSAVDCALEMQAINGPAASGSTVPLRVGINVGDVIEQGGDVFGDTVNIAARLEALAQPGGICISRAVRDHVGKQREIALEDIGFRSVKNIAEPVYVYAIKTGQFGRISSAQTADRVACEIQN